MMIVAITHTTSRHTTSTATTTGTTTVTTSLESLAPVGLATVIVDDTVTEVRDL